LACQLEQSFPGLQFYETPVIQKMNVFSQTFINEGMQAGIPNPTTRQKTITLYIDKKAFRQALDIPVWCKYSIQSRLIPVPLKVR
jgi:hypothetical protein